MLKNKKIIAIIPARGGSKRLPGKNIKKLVGKPLIGWTIEAALKSKYLHRVVVSTEDEKIAEVSKKFGAEIIKRPNYLATNTAKMIDVFSHTLKFFSKKKYIPDIVILLQPASPLRDEGDIDKAIRLFLRNKAESVVSVCEVEYPPYWHFKIENKYLKPIFGYKYLKMRRQDLLKSYTPNGAIYITTPRALLKYKSFYSSKTLPYIMPPEKSIDIDNELDFRLAELIKNKIIKNKRIKNKQ